MTTNNMDLSMRFLNQPIMIDDRFADTLQSYFPASMNIEDDTPFFSAVLDSEGNECASNYFYDGEEKLRRSYPVSKDGIAVISVYGTLLHKEMWAGYYITGYDSISMRHAIAERDPEVKGIVLDVNSHGGEVSGCFECVEQIKSQKTKPLWAMVDTNAHSAGYAVASVADTIHMTKTGSVGSVGVITMHVDQSEFLKNMGVKPTLIFKGKHKADGNSFEPLPDDVKAKIESRLESLYEIFVSTVAENRGMDADNVRSTEAETYSADEAILVGLADAVSSPLEMYSAFTTELIGSKTNEDYFMSKNDNVADANSSGHSNEALEAAKTQAYNEGMSAGVQAERERIHGIMGLEESASRPIAAKQLAMKSDMSVDAAKDFLAGMPEENATSQEVTQTPVGATNQFAAAMANSENPEVGSEDVADDDQGNDEFAGLSSAFDRIGRANGRMQ